MPTDQDAASERRTWFFEALAKEQMLRAIEPDGTVHIVHLGDMNSLAGIKLLNAMVRDLTRT